MEITSHNHGFAVAADSLAGDVEVTHINLNDRCVEGMRHKTLPIISVQYHPEAAPGPHDAEHHFQRFIELMATPDRAPGASYLKSEAHAGAELEVMYGFGRRCEN